MVKSSNSPNLQLIATRNEFRTIPQTGRWLYSQSIDNSGNGKDKPRHASVEFLKCFLLHNALHVSLNGCKANNNYVNIQQKLSDISLTFVSECGTQCLTLI